MRSFDGWIGVDMSVKLVMFNSKGQRRAFALAKAETVIGRSADCGLRIPLTDVSRKHCLVIDRQGEVRLRDLGSTNGTYVNNKRINEVLLQAGDRLTIGPVILTVQFNGKPIAKADLEKPPKKTASDTSDAISADIEAAIALGPDELEDTRLDFEAIIEDEADSLEIESIDESISQQLDQSDSQSGSQIE